MKIENTTPSSIDHIEGSDLYKFLQIVDSDFYPPLSQRPGGIKAFINSFLLKKGEIFVYKDPMIIGAIGYWYRGKNLDDCYCHLLAILPEYRKTRIGYQLLNEAFKTVDTSKLSKVSLRTWPENDATIYFAKSVGFEMVREYDDPAMNRTSLLFEMAVRPFMDHLDSMFPEDG